MKKQVLAMRINKNPSAKCADIFGEEHTIPIGLPEGSNGIMYVFESMKAARQHYGKGVQMIQIKDDTEEAK